MQLQYCICRLELYLILCEEIHFSRIIKHKLKKTAIRPVWIADLLEAKPATHRDVGHIRSICLARSVNPFLRHVSIMNKMGSKSGGFPNDK